MVIGIDMGASAVKLCGLEGDRVSFTHYEKGRGGDIPALLARLGQRPEKAEAVALTGLCAGVSGLSDRLPLRRIPEPEAIGAGGLWLSGRKNAVVASIGTGTAFIHADGTHYTHLGGTGLGGGTLAGLALHLFGLTDMAAFDRLAAGGRAGAVDLLIGDFGSAYGALDPMMTASNLARLSPDASDADWAAGVMNLVLQGVGTMSLLAARGCGAAGVVVTGAVAASDAARVNFELFTRLYGLDFVIPPHCACATAIGAARLAQCS